MFSNRILEIISLIVLSSSFYDKLKLFTICQRHYSSKTLSMKLVFSKQLFLIKIKIIPY